MEGVESSFFRELKVSETRKKMYRISRMSRAD